MSFRIEFVKYTEDFLDLSWEWLNDPQIKSLTMTPDFSREDQRNYFNKLPTRIDYQISGIVVNGQPAGACGLKNIKNGEAEFWCYIGIKKYWGLGLGAHILQNEEKRCQLLKVTILKLKVSNSNPRAFKLYERNGFQVKSKTIDYTLMAKNLLLDR
jgi:RimJ/RimL family protein N-acetyltransferase